MQKNRLSNIELLRELERVKSNENKALELLREINLRLDLNKLNFKEKEMKFLYLYMLLSNKYNVLSNLNTLIQNKDFIKTLDLSELNGSSILSLTDRCSKPRRVLLENSKNIKKSILTEDILFNPREILSDLTKEEMAILREDIEIDNYLINKGLRFDTLRPETISLLLSDVTLFQNYDIKTIREFVSNKKEAASLANNPKFLSIYVQKLDDDYNIENNIFRKLTIKQVRELKKNMNDVAYLHLLKDTQPTVQSELLRDKRAMSVLLNCDNLNVLSTLPKEYLLKILAEKDHLLSGVNYIMLRNLNKQEIAKLASNNKYFYSDLVNKIIENDDMDFKPFISALPPELLDDLSANHLSEFNLDVLKRLLSINKSFFKKSIINNKEVSNYLINRERKEELLELLDDSDFNNEEKIRLLNNCDDVKVPKNICAVLATIPETLRLPVYKNDYLRAIILSEKDFKLDAYTTKYLLNNYNETLDKPVSLLISLLIASDEQFAFELLSSEPILDKVFKEGSKEPTLLKQLLENKPKLLKFYKDERIKKYYNSETLTSLNSLLDPNEMNNICSNDVIENIYKDPELVKIYKKLLHNNCYLLNTLNFDFINENTKNLKMVILDKYTKYPAIQANILEISKKHPLSCEFLNQLYFATQDLEFEETVNNILEVFKSSFIAENKKRVGNLSKILKIANPSELSKPNFRKLINYLLYFIPRDKNIKPNIIKTPMTYNDIITYEIEVNKELTNRINKKENVRDNFMLKHFKLTSIESLNFIDKYSIERIDSKTYREEYEFLSNIQKIYNMDEESLIALDPKYKTITMLDSYIIEEKIKRMYAKIYNYEIRSKTYSNKPFLVNVFGKELQIYTCPNDFIFLISNVNITEEYQKTNSFFLGWHNTVNKIDSIHTSLITNDNLHLTKEITFGFNGILETGIKEISPYFIKYPKYMTPRELIDNTRDINNHLLLDKYAIRPNFNNSNLPNIEPDYILIDAKRLNDNAYLERVSRASEEFKTKRNKQGLPIIAIDDAKIAELELNKINNLFVKYQRNHDMYLLNSIITKLNNNLTAYKSLNGNLAPKFNISIIYQELIKRINNSNSISEIEYIENIFIEEEKKYKYLIKDFSKEQEVKELKRAIDTRIATLTKG